MRGKSATKRSHFSNKRVDFVQTPVATFTFNSILQPAYNTDNTLHEHGSRCNRIQSTFRRFHVSPQLIKKRERERDRDTHLKLYNNVECNSLQRIGKQNFTYIFCIFNNLCWLYRNFEIILLLHICNYTMTLLYMYIQDNIYFFEQNHIMVDA